MNPAKVNLTRRTHQTISFSSPRDKNIATESFQMIICMLGGIFSLPPFPFFFFFFACSIHDVGERNYKLLPKFIHSLLLILPFLFLLLLLLFSFPLHFSSLPSSCLFCGVLFFFFLEREKETAKVWHCVSATDAFFSSPQGHSSNNDL